ncbi:PREDICTED: uncharacterized protein LOC107110239 [Gekko japonicus]|uniref:Uncharacterized protein LOC107110239 n=1 Tax=Gekko japonicus TaxID=146911 RepID=A0ABM1JYD8_GEKJA|nr:PREDICTED: uncharacterized protein LOC107110239 [Gekko japonicus]
MVPEGPSTPILSSTSVRSAFQASIFVPPPSEAINQRLTPNQKFTPKDLIAAVKALDVELGLIIDLTYTTRYYNTKDLPRTVEYKKLYTVGHEVPDDPTILQFKKWVRKFLWENAGNVKQVDTYRSTERGSVSWSKKENIIKGIPNGLSSGHTKCDLPRTVEYKKLYTVGHEVPDDPTILQFKKWVRKFLWENAGNEKLIGVHCTNGVNRTGYLICRYLIDVEGWDPETAIQAFGEARGHHMDRGIYLTDLKTQPMRSNLGMNIWDVDVEIPLPNEMDGFPSEEFPRPEKRLRVYEDCHPHNDLSGQIQLREFDFINKGPGQRRKPYHDLQFQEELQPLMQIRERRFPEPQCYDDYQEESYQEDLDFAVRDSEQWQRSFPDHQFHDGLLENAPPGELVSMGRGQRQRHVPDSDMPTDMLLNRGRGQRYFPDSDMPTDMQLYRGHGQRQFPDGDMPTDMPLNRGRGQRRFPDGDMATDMPLHRGRGQRCFLDNDMPTDMPLHRGRGQRHFPDGDMPTNMSLNRGCGQRQFPDGDMPTDMPPHRGRGQRQFPDSDMPTDMPPHRGRGQRRFLDNDMPTDMPLTRGRGQRPRPFYDQQSNDELQPRMQLKDQPFLNMGRGQRMRPFHDCPPHSDMQPPVGDFEFVSRGRGQRIRPLLDCQHDNELRREMAFGDFEDRDSDPRCRSFHDHQSYGDFSEPAQQRDFVDSGPEQRMRPFNNHSPRDGVSHEGYLERGQSLPSREHFPDSSIFCRDYVSDKEDSNRNYRDDCPEDYRRIRLSDGINKGGKSRFAPYPSQPMRNLSSAHQKVSSVSADYGREPQHEVSREMDQGKRLPIVMIDYNYGLPLDCASEEEDGGHYDLPSRDRYLWN